MSRFKKQTVGVTVVCHCSCPDWGNPREIYECECECGERLHVCGGCLVEGRVTACPECSPKSRSKCECYEDREA